MCVCVCVCVYVYKQNSKAKSDVKLPHLLRVSSVEGEDPGTQLFLKLPGSPPVPFSVPYLEDAFTPSKEQELKHGGPRLGDFF